MKTKQKVMLWSLLAVLLVAMNTYLIFHKDSDVRRSFYVTDWQKVQKGDLIQTLNKSGKVVPAKEQREYFDPKQGTFRQFLVKKGDHIQKGTPLYEYRATDAKENRKTLEMKIDELQSTEKDLDAHLQELKQLKASAAEETEATVDSEAEDTETEVDTPETEPDDQEKHGSDSKSESESGSRDQSGIKYSIELEISQTQLQKDQTASKIAAYQNQVDDLKSHTNVKVKSQYAGTVRSISHDLKNPVVTIASDQLLVQGQLSEQDSTVVKKGMKTSITSADIKQDMKGKVGKVDKLPERESSIYEESSYPFTVQLNSKVKGVQPGYHVNLDIVTDQALDSVVIPDDVMEQKHTWVLTDQGKVNHRKVKTGLSVEGKHEIKDGLKQGEWLVTNPEQIKDEGSTFFTPLKWDAIHPTLLKEMGRYMLSRYFS